MTLIFIGTDPFGAPTLQKLLQSSDFTIPFIITGPDKPAGRGLKMSPSSIKGIALKNKLIVHQPARITEMKQKLIQAKPDFILLVAYGEIIPKEILDIPKIAPINIHPSLLPKHRGASPIQNSILSGDSVTGITWIVMNEKMDEGNIIAQKEIAIDKNDTGETLGKKLQDLAAIQTASVLIEFAKMRKSTKQNQAQASYCSVIEKTDGLLDPAKESAEHMLRKIRAYTPWPGCYINWHGKRLKIVQARVGEQKISSGELKVTEDGFLALGTRKDTLIPLRVKPESKREMSAEEFLRGLPGQKVMRLFP